MTNHFAKPAYTRRSFLQKLTTGAVVAPWVTSGLRAQSPNSMVHHASCGASNMAMQDLVGLTSHKSIKIVAACDVDEKRTAEFRKKWPEARVYADYREMLAQEKDLQSINVSTPDHMHAPQAMAAMQRGLHVYGQKPLTHEIYEARRLAEFAREKKLITQMGIQIHSHAAYRTGVRLIQSGAIGKVMEVHTFCDATWATTEVTPERSDAVPEGFNWDLWLGVAAARPFLGGGWYHQMAWRKHLDFGSGTFGDIGCHVFDPVFTALGLGAPLSVRSEGAAPNAKSWAPNSEIHFTFPGTQYTSEKTLPIVWYDGASKVPAAIAARAIDPASTEEKKRALPGTGSIFIGSEGVMVLPHIASPRLVGEKFKDFKVERIPSVSHWHQFIDTILGTDKCSANFDYAGPLTESVLLGCLATRFPKTELAWDAKALQFANVAEANQFLRRNYRKGWEVPGLSA